MLVRIGKNAAYPEKKIKILIGLKCHFILHLTRPLWVRRGDYSSSPSWTHGDRAAPILNTFFFGPHRLESLGGEFQISNSMFHPVVRCFSDVPRPH